VRQGVINVASIQSPCAYAILLGSLTPVNCCGWRI
jgi:hypothetical protein